MLPLDSTLHPSPAPLLPRIFGSPPGKRATRGAAILPRAGQIAAQRVCWLASGIAALALLLGASAVPVAAQAEADSDPRGAAPNGASSSNEIEQPGEVPSDDDTSLETATPDPTPRLPGIMQRDEDPVIDVVEQAGVGGPVGYASSGVLEVGGMGSIESIEGFTTLRLAPYVGWFIRDGLEIAYFQEFRATVSDELTRFSSLSLLELSGHLRLTDRLMAFLGAGPGFLYAGGPAFALRGRLGLDVLVGRSGLFRPAFTTTWATRDLVEPSANRPDSGQLALGLDISFAALF